MNSNKNIFKKALSVVSFVLVFLFFIWTKLIFISLLLVLVTDSISTCFFPNLLKRKLHLKWFNILKYSYYIILPVSLAIFFRTFFLDIYFVPSSSMERTLFPNDYVLVDKISYGTKIPKRIQDVPVVGGFLKKEDVLKLYDLYKPLYAFKKIQREDIVVFKSTQENNVFLIKRIIGMPGDILRIENAKVIINKNFLSEREDYCYDYKDTLGNGTAIIKTFSNKEFENLDRKYQDGLKKDIKKTPSKRALLFPYPISLEKQWTRDNYGPIEIPKRGMTIILDKDNFIIYKNILLNFENENFEVLNNETKTYSFKNNYYFMMGDNRHGSSDSRSFGFVPESYIQGKMIKALSKDRILNSLFSK